MTDDRYAQISVYVRKQGNRVISAITANGHLLPCTSLDLHLDAVSGATARLELVVDEITVAGLPASVRVGLQLPGDIGEVDPEAITDVGCDLTTEQKLNRARVMLEVLNHRGGLGGDTHKAIDACLQEIK